MKKPEINLSILNSLVKSLNDDLELYNATEGMSVDAKVIAISKLMGLAQGIVQEASLLNRDFAALGMLISSPGNKADDLGGILGNLVKNTQGDN